MKKILIVAALLVATSLSAAPVAAAGTAAATPKMNAVCFFLPFLPDCLAEMKDMHGMMGKMAMPKMMALPTCTKAAAGSGHLFDCK